MRIIDKKGPLTYVLRSFSFSAHLNDISDSNPADRDHCLQYMAAIGLIFGELTADHYEEEIGQDPRIDALRAKMTVMEDVSCDQLFSKTHRLY